VWGGWLSKPFQKELAMHRLTFDPGQRRVLLLVMNIYENLQIVRSHFFTDIVLFVNIRSTLNIYWFIGI
jgi:hypothetical protein